MTLPKEADLTIAYLDCSAGVSGDMLLGALVDAGAQLREIEKELRRLPVKGYRIESRRVKRASISAAKIDVIVSNSRTASHSAKTWKDIKVIIDSSSLSPYIKQRGLRIFRRLFEAEGKIHGTAYNKTHLHELGAVDCIIDIYGVLIGLDMLGVDKVYSSPINLGSGSVMTGHGRLPVPAPATTEILKEMPVYISDIPFELTTPTGAAILKEIVSGFNEMPSMNIKKIGYGAGQRDIKGISNTLRIILGEDISESNSNHLPKVTVIETNIDDMNPQIYEYAMDMLFKKGALDVYLTQVIMKKGRPAVLLTILCDEDKKADIIKTLFRETTTIGLRIHESSRVILKREMREVNTEFGRIRFKTSRLNDGTIKYSPEYEDCKRAAKKYGFPLREIMGRLNSIKKI